MIEKVVLPLDMVPDQTNNIMINYLKINFANFVLIN